MSYNEMKERFEHHAYQCRGMAKSAIIGLLIGLVLSVLMLGFDFNPGFVGFMDWLLTIIIMGLLLGVICTVIVSIFVIKEGKFALYSVLAICSRALLGGFVNAISGSILGIALYMIPLFIFGSIASVLICVYSAVLPITTIYHAAQYFRYKKMLAM